MRERAREAGGELEGAMDDFNLSGSKAVAQADAVGFLTKYNVLPQHTSILTEAWKRKLQEYEEVLSGKDPQLVEAYSHLTKTQVKNTIKFIESMLASINSYISNKKASKAPRQRKAVPPEKVVANLKYLKEFKDDKLKLNLVSVHPKTLLTASEAWVYDTAKRRLYHFMADDLAKTFSVKGNTLLGFDTLKSEVKGLRKPVEQIKEIMGSKPVARKYFKDIKSVSSSPKGRFNAGMIILKAF
jgi:ATP adenylyltransferase/5',5'''-P-1,P-4-tetraphosphate phosphorylase II